MSLVLDGYTRFNIGEQFLTNYDRQCDDIFIPMNSEIVFIIGNSIISQFKVLKCVDTVDGKILHNQTFWIEDWWIKDLLREK